MREKGGKGDRERWRRWGKKMGIMRDRGGGALRIGGGIEDGGDEGRGGEAGIGGEE